MTIETLKESSNLLLPFATLVLGLSSSLHCAGMCGPLVMAVAHDKKSVFIYQVGRLLAYMLLASVVSLLGQATLRQLSPQLNQWATYFIAAVFVLIGVKIFFNKNFELPLPRFFSQFFLKFNSKVLQKFKGTVTGSFLVGFSSIMLPCGILYATIFSLVAMKGLNLALLSIFTFWVGTLPVMVLGPSFFRKYLSGLVARFPRVTGLMLIAVGLLALYYRHGNKLSCH